MYRRFGEFGRAIPANNFLQRRRPGRHGKAREMLNRLQFIGEHHGRPYRRVSASRPYPRHGRVRDRNKTAILRTPSTVIASSLLKSRLVPFGPKGALTPLPEFKWIRYLADFAVLSAPDDRRKNRGTPGG